MAEESEGWFLSFHCFTSYMKVAFFRGQTLRPMPRRRVETEGCTLFPCPENVLLDEAQFTDWVKQASKLPRSEDVKRITP